MENKDWAIQAIPLDMIHPISNRKSFPASWCGLTGHRLAEVSGVKSVKFCHNNGFFAVAGNKCDTIKLAKKAISFS